ncbi:hypothetical protein PT974_08230 [Cladobotryum mycophilum]|uniref:Uncharacterized protein n=1 Tax=Cladobotryum mycophilum TaxID=491253 RepID=A0ABR0SCR8_9HYPO
MPLINVPDFHTSLLTLLHSLSKKTYFADMMSKHGHVETVAKNLLACVDSDILQLQGKELTVRRLHEVRMKQHQPWRKDIGYMDYITDDGNHDYFRIHVGQARDGEKRILNNHSLSILSGHHDTLHYYIIWLGMGNRNTNFMRLWSILNATGDEEWSSFRRNVLELMFCFAFQTLPPSELHHHFGGAAGGHSHQTLGLNVLSPLFQNSSPTAAHRTFARKALEVSIDP